MAWAIVILAVVAGGAALVVGHELQGRARARHLQIQVDVLQHQVEELRAEQAASRRAALEADRDLLPPSDLSVIEPESGLHNQWFFDATLDARVSAARRHLRPLALVLLEVVEGVREGALATAPAALVGECIRRTLREADTACRRADGRYALILEDTPENGAVWTVERVRRAIAEQAPDKTVWAGVACYPATAFNATGLVDQASTALTTAREWRQDRIEVAAAEP